MTTILGNTVAYASAESFHSMALSSVQISLFGLVLLAQFSLVWFSIGHSGLLAKFGLVQFHSTKL